MDSKMRDIERIEKMEIPTLEYIKANPKLVTMKPTQYENVFVLKYSRKVFHKYLWDATLCECRGTLVDGDMNVVSRSLTKIFNSDEPFAPEFADDEEIYVDDKINGFMACATWHNNELIVSTTGTTWSEFADVAREYIMESIGTLMFKDFPDYSFSFEICTPEDAHFIDEMAGVYLLGARLKEWSDVKGDISREELDAMAEKYRGGWSIYRPQWYVTSYGRIKEVLKNYNREGFVITSTDEPTKQVKMKSPYYLTTKFLSRLNNDNVERLLTNPQIAKSKIDEEFFPIVDYLNEHLEHFKTLTNNEKSTFIKDFFDE